MTPPSLPPCLPSLLLLSLPVRPYLLIVPVDLKHVIAKDLAKNKLFLWHLGLGKGKDGREGRREGGRDGLESRENQRMEEGREGQIKWAKRGGTYPWSRCPLDGHELGLQGVCMCCGI